MARRPPNTDPPEYSAVFVRSYVPSEDIVRSPSIIVASACRTTREVVAWSTTATLGVRCFLASSACEALSMLGRDSRGRLGTTTSGQLDLPGAILLETALLLESTAGPALCRVLHDLELPTFILRIGPARDLPAAERAADSVLPALRDSMARCA